MFYVRNQGGRIVCLDQKEQFDFWMAQPGFTEPSLDDIRAWQQAREEDFRERQARSFIKNRPGGDVFLATVSGGNDGYGMASGNIYRELTKLGVNISYQNKGQPVGLLFHAPYSIARLDSPYRIIYTMFESTKIPDDWHEYLKAANKILVPSRWCQEVFKKSGVETEVIPLGYDDRYFKFIERKNKRIANETFKFLHYNAYNLRKGFIEVIQAFTQEFESDEPVKLVLKTNLKQPPFPFDERKYPNIEVINQEMDVFELAALCGSCDCFLFPSRGEGFGLTPLEAMATGMPAIIPNAHGISEYFNPSFMYEVKIGQMVPATYYRYKGQDVGQMFLCDVAHLRQQMRYVYEHQDEALEKGRYASKYVKRYTATETAQKLKQVFDDILSKPLPARVQSNVLSLEMV